jgi:predicted Holliday junction resolvase-like endonuclease
MDITDIIPESINDTGAILFWVIILILIIAVVALYLYVKRMKKKIVTIRQEMTTQLDGVKKTKEKRMQELSEVKSKVDRILEEEKK